VHLVLEYPNVAQRHDENSFENNAPSLMRNHMREIEREREREREEERMNE
jgi:hypothetical protein